MGLRPTSCWSFLKEIESLNKHFLNISTNGPFEGANKAGSMSYTKTFLLHSSGIPSLNHHGKNWTRGKDTSPKMHNFVNSFVLKIAAGGWVFNHIAHFSEYCLCRLQGDGFSAMTCCDVDWPLKHLNKRCYCSDFPNPVWRGETITHCSFGELLWKTKCQVLWEKDTSRPCSQVGHCMSARNLRMVVVICSIPLDFWGIFLMRNQSGKHKYKKYNFPNSKPVYLHLEWCRDAWLNVHCADCKQLNSPALSEHIDELQTKIKKNE